MKTALLPVILVTARQDAADRRQRVPLPNDVRFGILPKGRILRSPCRTFYLQLIEPPTLLANVP